MAEMKTLNGHEIVDAAARKRLDEMEKNGVGGGGTVVAYDTDSDTGTANYTASEIKALVDSGKTVVVENGNSGNTLIKYVDYIDGVAIFEHTFVEGVTISTIRYEIDENKNVSYEIATVSPVTSVNGKTSETGDVELSASDVGAYSKEETNEMISSIPRFNIEVVDVHPTITEASTTTVYLVPSGADDQNLYTEWICVEKDGARTWEKLGTQNLDLTGYVTTEELAASVERALSEAKESGEFKGDKGDQGEQGIQGAAGVSPTVTVTEITGGHRVSVTDASETKTFDVMDGEKGDPYTLTEDDKAEIVAEIGQIEPPTIVSSVDEMTDTTKHYVNQTTGTIWAYMAQEKVVPGSNYNVFNYDTSDGARINTRLNQGGVESTTNGAKGSFITNYIETPKWDETTAPYNMYINFPIQSVSLSATIICYYDSAKAFISSNVVNDKIHSISGEETTIDLKTFGTSSSYTEVPSTGVAYVRCQLFKNVSGTAIADTDLEDVEIMLEANKTPAATVKEYSWTDTGISYTPTFKTDLIGVLGEDNVIYLSENLPSGTYTLKYGDETYDTIGTITVE